MPTHQIEYPQHSAIHIVIVGDVDAHEFHDVVAFVYQHQTCQVVAEFRNLKQFLTAQSASTRQPDLLLILQSWSDQFAPAEINRLIGSMVFRRIICCYGCWCESDGRTRDFWPPVMRVSEPIVVPMLELCFSQAVRGVPALPATASREEVFYSRSGDGKAFRFAGNPGDLFLVISSDQPLRQTIRKVLEALGVSVVAIGSDLSDLTPGIRGLKRIPRFIILDLDNPLTGIQSAIRQLNELFPASGIWGVSAFLDCLSQQDRAMSGIDQLIPKLDLLYGLRAAFATIL